MGAGHRLAGPRGRGDSQPELVPFRVVAASPGLYFVGLAFQYAFASMLVGGAGRDAEYVVRQITAAPARMLTPGR